MDAGVATLPDRIALIGFMAAGKSTVARILAARLGYDFVDTDQMLAARAGAPIAEIFRARGEPAFRDMEAALLAELAARPRAVIATGGGAPVQPRNRAFFLERAVTFHLRVSLEAARDRTRGDRTRPLMAGEDAEVRDRYEARLPIYESLGKSIDTEGMSPEQVADRIMLLLENPRQSPGSVDES
jgi:shikimate kinase